ncbi:MAG: ABC transporter ATP-binding protein [Salinigranum sp.]
MTVSFEGVSVGYGGDPVVSDVTLDVADGEVVGLLGPNGVGKTTLLKTVPGLTPPMAGAVEVDGDDVADLDRRELARRVGYVSQTEAPSNPATVYEAVLMGRAPYLSWRASEGDHEAVAEVLSTLELESLSTRDVRRLSGGQRQKVALARALAQRPSVLALDEPTSDLDVRHEVEVLEVLTDRADDGVSAVLAMHDINVAARFCDRLVLLADGGVYDVGGPEVLTPRSIERVYGIEAEVRVDDEVTVVPRGVSDRRG